MVFARKTFPMTFAPHDSSLLVNFAAVSPVVRLSFITSILNDNGVISIKLKLETNLPKNYRILGLKSINKTKRYFWNF